MNPFRDNQTNQQWNRGYSAWHLLQSRELCWPLCIREQMLLEALSISQQTGCQGLNSKVVFLAEMLQQHGQRWSRAGAGLLCLPDPLSNQTGYRGFGSPAVSMKKRHTKKLRGHGWDNKDGMGQDSQRCFSNSLHPTLVLGCAHPARSLFELVMRLRSPRSEPRQTSDKDEVCCRSHGAC